MLLMWVSEWSYVNGTHEGRQPANPFCLRKPSRGSPAPATTGIHNIVDFSEQQPGRHARRL